MRRIIIITVMVLVFTGCVKIGEFYVGLNMQPDMTDSPFEPGLNVFGVVKCGTNFDTVNYHFEVQNMLDLHDWSAGMEVQDAQIQLKRITSGGKEFTYNLDFIEGASYGNDAIETLPGDRWEYTCAKDSFEVTATCIVPELPVIGHSSVSENTINFTVDKDSTAFMYFVYVFQNENIQTEFKIPQPASINEFSIQPNWKLTSEPVQIFVCAYDRNLREYQTTSNTFFKPNAFRPSFSTVDGGYGTFGAISISSVIFQP